MTACCSPAREWPSDERTTAKTARASEVTTVVSATNRTNGLSVPCVKSKRAVVCLAARLKPPILSFTDGPLHDPRSISCHIERIVPFPAPRQLTAVPHFRTCILRSPLVARRALDRHHINSRRAACLLARLPALSSPRFLLCFALSWPWRHNCTEAHSPGSCSPLHSSVHAMPL